MFVTKIKPEGSGLLYSTYLGGSTGDFPNNVALDASGDAYVAGKHAFAPTFRSPRGPSRPSLESVAASASTPFVTKLTPDGSGLVYSTYLGGSRIDEGNGIAVDSSGDAYVTGQAGLANFPITTGAFQTTLVGFTGRLRHEVRDSRFELHCSGGDADADRDANAVRHPHRRRAASGAVPQYPVGTTSQATITLANLGSVDGRVRHPDASGNVRDCPITIWILAYFRTLALSSNLSFSPQVKGDFHQQLSITTRPAGGAVRHTRRQRNTVRNLPTAATTGGDPHRSVQSLAGAIGKLRDSRYGPGQHSGSWVKLRVNQGQEIGIGGYVPTGRDSD